MTVQSRAKNEPIWPLVTGKPGEKVVAVVPRVIPSLVTVPMLSKWTESADTSVNPACILNRCTEP